MKITLTNIITYVGIAVLLLYIVVGIMGYYGISSENYILYIIFYLFMFLSLFILGPYPS
jgi:hypothetical protein